MKSSLLLTVIAACLLGFTTPQQTPTESPPRLIVISLDGARPDAILEANTPFIQGLAQSGAAAWEAQTIFPPVTLPAHASMLTGLAVEDHNVDWNGTNIGCIPIEAPTFITTAAEAGYKTGMVVGKEKFCHFRQSEAVDYTFALEGDRSVVDRVIELLDDDYQVIFAHFPNPDYFGHSIGWMSPIYISQFTQTDRQVGRILTELETLGIADNTWIIITADHGGHDLGHGQDIPVDMTIPWLISGPGVQVDLSLDGMSIPVNVADTAATVLWLLGLDQPENALGQPVCAAFTAEMLEKRPCPQYSNSSEVE